MGVSARPLAGMADALRHRGPDGEGFALYSRGGEIRAAASLAEVASMPGPYTAGLAHTGSRSSTSPTQATSRCSTQRPATRLSTTARSTTTSSSDERSTGRGHRFTTTGDTEVVLRAYIEWGERCVERFVGMWAFAVLDPSRNVLFLSRDRFGIKPLYYWSANGTFCFASEIKALRAVPTVDPKPDRGWSQNTSHRRSRRHGAHLLRGHSAAATRAQHEHQHRRVARRATVALLGTARRRWRRIGGRRHRAFSRGA